MLLDKDLVLLNYSAQEAESILHLNHFHMTTEKIVNYSTSDEDTGYWAYRGIYLNPIGPETLIDKLLPYRALSHGREGWQYGDMDVFIDGTTVLSAMRTKPYDCFISYFSGDKDFVARLSRDLELREIEVWHDVKEVDVGDSISEKIEEGLSRSYSFVIVLSPEALSRPWVKKELQAAHALNAAGEFKILPVLHKECVIPPLLEGYKFADFRDEKRYQEQLRLLASSIRSAVRRAQEKQSTPTKHT
jgi:TIR domain